MKKQVLLSVMLATMVLLPAVICARGFMPRIDQLKNKVESVAQNTSKQNIKDLLENAKIERDANGTIHKILSLGQPKEDSVVLEKDIKALYWSNNSNFAAQIQTKNLTSKTENRDLLIKELAQKYPGNNRAIFTLANDLANEETKMADLTTRIMKTIGDTKNTDSKTIANKLLASIANLKQNLQIITTFVNEILMG